MGSRILVVEDEPENRLLIGIVLRNEGYEVIEAEDGPAALSIVERQHPDLVLLDVMMPGMNGFAVFERLRANDRLRAVPVIMLTALAQRADVERAVQLGVDGYVTKPFEPAELVQEVQRALAGRSSPPPAGAPGTCHS